ncbi:hypothetical protein SmJEL517_g02912 [Synchytrium microbalum]|uniref:Cilia- and flagella-associated protein 206 n=1 Tax=Synchytrium microbalum TaxID=1806994 RepID=A0A507CA86_9FUNG|nr:uncharacterized protein SmJEL517_g02912 [Synchytrium microbalum]TPX34453.1 hypothetical protein SmJEL517_g02912 [Synchytrium microbalum]
MSADEILRHIIRDVSARATRILRTQRAQHPPLVTAISAATLPTTLFATTPSNPYAGGVSDRLSAFVIRSIVMDEREGFRIEAEMTKEQVEKLVKRASDLTGGAVGGIVWETVRMQVEFDGGFGNQAEFLSKEKQARIQSVSNVAKEILEAKTKSIAAYDALYGKIITYLLARSYIGSPTDLKAVRETTAALESVFPPSELGAFIALGRQEREAQLTGLMQLVMGIRLFNMKLGKGGDSIEKLPDLCNRELRELSDLVKTMMTSSENLVQVYSAAIQFLSQQEYAPETPSITQLKSGLIFQRQLLTYLDALEDTCQRSNTALTALSARFESSIQELKSTCRAKTAVPVDQVYPQFIAISALWMAWLDELYLLAFRQGLVSQLEAHSRNAFVEIPESLMNSLDPLKRDIEPEILNDQSIIARATEVMVAIPPLNRAIEVIHPGNSTQYWKLPVEYGGYCPVTLVQQQGLLVPGDKSICLLKYRSRLFAVASKACALAFARNPDGIMEQVLEWGRQSPDLVGVLCLAGWFPTVEVLDNAKFFPKNKLFTRPPLCADAASQVDTHIVDQHVDPKYQWNEWELRRQALMLVALKTKLTHSAQTDVSHFRRDSETQHYQPKVQETQTRRDAGTTIPKKVNYMAGLRGSTQPGKFKILDLTIERK